MKKTPRAFQKFLSLLITSALVGFHFQIPLSFASDANDYRARAGIMAVPAGYSPVPVSAHAGGAINGGVVTKPMATLNSPDYSRPQQSGSISLPKDTSESSDNGNQGLNTLYGLLSPSDLHTLQQYFIDPLAQADTGIYDSYRMQALQDMLVQLSPEGLKQFADLCTSMIDYASTHGENGGAYLGNLVNFFGFKNYITEQPSEDYLRNIATFFNKSKPSDVKGLGLMMSDLEVGVNGDDVYNDPSGAGTLSGKLGALINQIAAGPSSSTASKNFSFILSSINNPVDAQQIGNFIRETSSAGSPHNDETASSANSALLSLLRSDNPSAVTNVITEAKLLDPIGMTGMAVLFGQVSQVIDGPDIPQNLKGISISWPAFLAQVDLLTMVKFLKDYSGGLWGDPSPNSTFNTPEPPGKVNWLHYVRDIVGLLEKDDLGDAVAAISSWHPDLHGFSETPPSFQTLSNPT